MRLDNDDFSVYLMAYTALIYAALLNLFIETVSASRIRRGQLNGNAGEETVLRYSCDGGLIVCLRACD